jgi:magnesium transporter
MRALVFDFEARTEREVAPGDAAPLATGSQYVWFDLDADGDPSGVERVLRRLGLDGSTVTAALEPDTSGSYHPIPSGLHLSVVAPEAAGETLTTQSVDMLIGQGYCATVHRGVVAFLEEAWRTCPDDFRSFAQSPGFLLYEFWDHLIASYRRAAELVGDRVLQAQEGAFDTGDEIFGRVSALSRDLLMLRRAMVSAREVLAELATRRSALVPSSTQPFLQALVAALDRLVADLAVEREILAEALNLYIGMVGHRTNQVVNRLTVVSFVFLPLTFLCGIYGMNFEGMPELRWHLGYSFFWVVSLLIAASTLTYMKFKGWW